MRHGHFMHRAMSLLNNLLNVALGSVYLPTMQIIALLCLYTTVSMSTRLRAHFTLPVYFCCILYLVTIAVIRAGASVLSQVFSISCSFHPNMHKHLDRVTDKKKIYLSRVLRSLLVLKCRIGCFYYMEDKAKLTLADNVVSRIAFVLTFKLHIQNNLFNPNN